MVVQSIESHWERCYPSSDMKRQLSPKQEPIAERGIVTMGDGLENGSSRLVESNTNSVVPTTNTLLQRVFSGIVLVVLVVAAAYAGVWVFALLFSTVVLISLSEFYRALEHAGYDPSPSIGYISALLFGLAALLRGIVPGDLTGGTLCFIILLTFLGDFWKRTQKMLLINRALTFLGACVIGWLSSHSILLLKLDMPIHETWFTPLDLSAGTAWLYTVFAINWMHDTVAFLIGRTWGRHQIAPVTSPKKTWEGFLAGMAGSIITALLLVALFGLPISVAGAILLGIVGGLGSLFGDLSISLIKRQIGIKDMGSIIPGHGGLLDRIDSSLFSVPVLYYLILLLVEYTPA